MARGAVVLGRTLFGRAVLRRLVLRWVGAEAWGAVGGDVVVWAVEGPVRIAPFVLIGAGASHIHAAPAPRPALALAPFVLPAIDRDTASTS